jgi:hypothetical protein
MQGPLTPEGAFHEQPHDTENILASDAIFSPSRV